MKLDLKKDDYYLAFFLVGAYQDALGMKHNLFSNVTQANGVIEDDKIISEVQVDPHVAKWAKIALERMFEI